jgi:hypothetical protein
MHALEFANTHTHYLVRLQVPFNTMEGRRKCKAVDWLMFLRTCIPYAFSGIGPAHPQMAFKSMIAALQMLLDATADFDPGDAENVSLKTCRAAKIKVAQALTLMERDFPHTELSIAIHELIHVPDFIYRWNAVRNYWCFVVERLVGFMKTFVKNRSLAVQNMVHRMHVSSCVC